MAPKVIPELKAAAEDYRRKRDARMKETKPESTAKKKVVELMEKHKLTEHLYVDAQGEDHVIEVKYGKPKVKVRKAVEDGDPEE